MRIIAVAGAVVVFSPPGAATQGIGSKNSELRVFTTRSIATVLERSRSDREGPGDDLSDQGAKRHAQDSRGECQIRPARHRTRPREERIERPDRSRWTDIAAAPGAQRACVRQERRRVAHYGVSQHHRAALATTPARLSRGSTQSIVSSQLLALVGQRGVLRPNFDPNRNSGLCLRAELAGCQGANSQLPDRRRVNPFRASATDSKS